VHAEARAHAELALADILDALRRHRDSPAYWAQLEACVAPLDLRHPLDASLRQTLLDAFDHPAVEPSRLARPIVGLVATHPDAAAFARLPAPCAAVDEPPWQTLVPHMRNLLREPLLLRLLADTVVPSAFVQRIVACARRGLLGEVDANPGAEPSLPLPAIAAIAHQGFNTEYANAESAVEAAMVERLCAGIGAARGAGTPVPLHWYAIAACYRPPHTLADAEAIAAELAPTPLGSLAVRQVREPLEERGIRSTIAALTAVDDGVSAAVQEQYEANPYPRWQRTSRPSAPMPLVAFLRQEFPCADLAGVADRPIRILVAGCGTGRHPIGTAQRFANASVLAIDLSRTSLAYAIRKSRALGVANIEYAQADLLALGALPDRFDVIECAGVLHHLRDPLAGWKVLVSLLRPGGAMRIALYSERARRHVVRARELVAAEGFAPTPEGIRAFRAAVLARADDPLLARLAQGEDFYSRSGCRDLAFHVEERRFTLPGVAAMLHELGLRFLGFEGLDPGVAAAYRARFPADRALTDLASWDRFEAERPDTFAGMYRFWVCGPALSPR
jgi:SAM-dependent methyltransferase